MRLYSSYFTLLNRIMNKEIEAYKSVLRHAVEKYTSDAYWELFGYVYFGIFALKKTERLVVLNLISDNQHYAKEIFSALYFDDKVSVSDNRDIVYKIINGQERFVADASDLLLSEDVLIQIYKTVIMCFNEYLSKYDECQLMKIYKNEMVGKENYRIPLNHAGRMSIGVINPWPGDWSAESEVIARINRSAKDAGIKCTLLSDWGHILRENDQKKTKEFVDATDLDFVLTTHYLTPKSLDSYYYHTLWNPPEIPLNLGEYNQYITNNYLMNDDYLIYDTGGMRNHLMTILMNKPRSIEDASMLTTSFPESSMLDSKLEDPKMFYCGMNWDKLVNHQTRHEGLFKLLDETGKIKFFGPDVVKSWGGMKPWEGYRCYQYPIPWDGFSILKEINTCGVCLVISSDVHRRAGAVTTRAYEACAAGAVMISDNNEFMQKYFADAALFIYYNRNDPQDTFRQIMEKYNWIINHRQEALAMVNRAQQIFREKFALDKQLLNIVSNHTKRFFSIAKDLFAKDDSKQVLVTYVLNSVEKNDIEEKLDIVIKNINRQYYINIKLVIAIDRSQERCVKEYLFTQDSDAEYEVMELFDKKGIRCMTDGQAIRKIQKSHAYDYYVNMSAREIWFYDHITTLVRTIEDEGSYGAYSGRAFLDRGDRYTRTDWFNVYSDAELSSMSDIRVVECPGEFMFTKATEEYMPDYIFDSLDGLEHYAYANILQIKNDLVLSFSKRMTAIYNGAVSDDRNTVVDRGMQVRLIQDMVRFELKMRKKGGENFTFNPMGQSYPDIMLMIKDAFLKVPMKRWVKYRWHVAVVRLFGSSTKIGQRHMVKAQTIKNTFFENWS
ncbi:glycosyltransferase [Lacrimispora sp. 38-1]|uniref:glycosyltransferase n=1 Tax=Lacrimispora sp. 38-1 TaxID=3125778 RepID=UPI003CF81A22